MNDIDHLNIAIATRYIEKITSKGYVELITKFQE